MNTNFSVEFNNTVENVKNIVREARHMNINSHLYGWLTNNIVRFLDDVNFKMFFVDDEESYVMPHLLDALDILKDVKDDEHCVEGSNDYKVVNSIYDAIHEFYFEY